MAQAFESFVARRYLTARRKQAVISVVTLISVIGVAAGVMALILALAITNGFRSTLEQSLIGATAHVSVLEKEPANGISNWKTLMGKLSQLPHVLSATPVLYGQVLYSGATQGQGGVVKGLPDQAAEWRDLPRYLKSGSLAKLKGASYPGIILGVKLAQRTGMLQDGLVTVISPNGESTPLGPRPSYYRFRVAGIFETGFFDVDNSWGFAELPEVQKVLGVDDVVNAVELKLDSIDRASEVAVQAERLAGPTLAATTWQELNRQVLGALKMDRVVTVLTISLIQLVAALNILISLTMMVMEKNRDIAILVSMGARLSQIRRIFILQGLFIGAVGAAIGLTLGFSIAFFADHYRWFSLDSDVYALSYVPFQARGIDGVWVAAGALAVSYLATLYPASKAVQVQPAESLRYE